MPLLHQLLVAFFSCFVSYISAATSADRFSRFENVRDNDVLFTEDIMLQSLARSKLDCGRQCSNQLGCETFTFTKGSPLGSCRGHSSVMSSGRPKTSSVGSRSLILREMLITRCGPSPIVDLATPLSSSRAVGTTLQYSCGSNAMARTGPPGVTCQSNGTWTKPSFFCAACGDQVNVSGNAGTLTSPGYPGDYPSDMYCYYVITLEQPGPQNVRVSITYNLESEAICDYDSIEVNQDGQLYCGNGSVTKWFEVPGRQWVIVFKSDASITRPNGFVIDYSLV